MGCQIDSFDTISRWNFISLSGHFHANFADSVRTCQPSLYPSPVTTPCGSIGFTDQLRILCIPQAFPHPPYGRALQRKLC